MSLATRLYRGEFSYDFIGRRRRFYAISAAFLVISLLSMLIRGFDLGIDFRGGASFTFPSHGHTVADAQRVVGADGIRNPIVQKIGQGKIRLQTPPISDATVSKLSDDLAREFGVAKTDLSPSTVGASWGSEITKKAIQGLLLFLVCVAGYIALRFEPKMAAAAFVALLHDLVITAGIYSLVGFEVTPSTIIALLTILGFSLYDTVVVFDKVRENTAEITKGRLTYSEAANLAVNQTLMRSINTSLIALLPVAALLFVGAGLLGAGTLKDLALAQFVGLASGAYSSIFVATPLLTQLKERDPQLVALTTRLERQRAARGVGTPATTAATATTALEVAPGGGVALAVADDEPVARPRSQPAGASGRPGRPGQRSGGRGNSGRPRRRR